MFIIIFYDDGEVKCAPNLDTDLLDAVDDGIIDVLDISDPDCVQQYTNGGWSAIDSIGR